MSEFADTELGQWLLEEGFTSDWSSAMSKKYSRGTKEISIYRQQNGYEIVLTVEQTGYYGYTEEFEFKISDEKSVKEIVTSIY